MFGITYFQTVQVLLAVFTHKSRKAQMTETTETGFAFNVHANSIHELRDVLSDAHDLVTEMFDTANKAVYDFERAQRGKAFIRYCFTGKFD